MPTPSLDLRRSLYDSCGCRHTLVHATPRQVLTRFEGAYWLWDRASGQCLVNGLAGERLSNERPADADLRAHGDSVAETRAYLLARDVMRQAAGRPDAWLPAVPVAAAPVEDPSGRPVAARTTAPVPLSSLALLAAAACAFLLPLPARR